MHPFRAVSSVGAVLTALPLALGALAAPAAAPPAAAAPGQTALASPQALPTAQIDGVVWDQAVVGNTVYVVGEFHNARPAGAAAGENESPRYNAMAFDITTGALLDWAPKVNGKISSVEASADGSTIYLGGNFTSVNDETVYRVAAVDAAGKRKPLGASANGAVMDMELSPDGSTLYMSGSFTQINSSSRQRAGAVDLKTNKVTSFAPQVDDFMVRSITVAADNSAVAIGGSFTSVGGSSDGYGVAILEKDGSLRHTNIASVVRNAGKDSGFMSLKSDSRGVYAVAYSQEGAFEGMFRASWTGGDIDLMADCHGDTYDVLPTSDVIYIASHSHDCSNIGGFSDGEQSGTYHHAVGFSSTATGTVKRNSAWGYTNFEAELVRARARTSPMAVSSRPSTARTSRGSSASPRAGAMPTTRETTATTVTTVRTRTRRRKTRRIRRTRRRTRRTRTTGTTRRATGTRMTGTTTRTTAGGGGDHEVLRSD